MQVKKDDNVLILAGKDAGKEGKILTALPKANRVVVEGVNIQHRHTKPRSAQQTGGILDQAGPIDASNVMVICPKCKKATRIANTVEADGTKHRTCKKCGENLDKKKQQDAAKKETKKPAAKKEKKEAKAEEKKAE